MNEEFYIKTNGEVPLIEKVGIGLTVKPEPIHLDPSYSELVGRIEALENRLMTMPLHKIRSKIHLGKLGAWIGLSCNMPNIWYRFWTRVLLGWWWTE